MEDEFNLQRFVHAQNSFSFEQVCEELKGGRKLGHWMWFIFPQIAGLGTSPRSTYFAIRSQSEARAFLTHDVLGPRMDQLCSILLALEGLSMNQVFGSLDAMKLKSSMTLFAHANQLQANVFEDVIRKYFEGKHDERTLNILSRTNP